MRSQMATCLKSRLGKRSLVLVGLMGAGKSTIGRCLAKILDLPFCDSDHEIESVSKMTIPELFLIDGEQTFRNLEQQVIFRLLSAGVSVLATGGGAFMNAEIRHAIRRHGLSIWLKADLDLLTKRVLHKKNRPLLQQDNPRNVLQKLMNERYPVYAEADIIVPSRNTCYEIIARDVIKATDHYLMACKRSFVE
ncbi:MAG: shikimate kinase [Candidatus Tokpelaia sp. JSC085]|nr:MAG: shikimate kinase [Candidatus Tokpelaia sp. JSC085]